MSVSNTAMAVTQEALRPVESKSAAKRHPSIIRTAVLAVSLIAVGCIANNLILEVIVSKKTNPWADPGAGGLLTFLQFLFVAALNVGEAFSFSRGPSPKSLSPSGKSAPDSTISPLILLGVALPLRLRPSQVPRRHYFYQTLLFFSMSYLNNLAFNFNISQPLHMVFRSANLITTFVMGYLFFRRKYTLPQFVCVALLTLGAICATFAEALSGDTAKLAASAARSLVPGAAPTPCVDCPDGATPNVAALTREAAATAAASSGGADAATAAAAAGASAWFMVVWCMGVAILTAVLIIQTCLANYQSWAAEAFGRAPNEAMFYMHAFSLPLFLFTLPNMLAHAGTWSASPPTGEIMAEMLQAAEASAAGAPSLASFVWARGLYWATLPLAPLPIMWTYIIVNVVSQYLCIKGVYNLTPIADPLTVNVTLTVRKFLSLLVSIVMFNNTFTVAHWVGACLVFAGAAAYGQMPGPPKLPAADPKAVTSKAADAEAGDSASDGTSSAVSASGSGAAMHHRPGAGGAGPQQRRASSAERTSGAAGSAGGGAASHGDTSGAADKAPVSIRGVRNGHRL